jgi:hypothetical protein
MEILEDRITPPMQSGIFADGVIRQKFDEFREATAAIPRLTTLPSGAARPYSLTLQGGGGVERQ